MADEIVTGCKVCRECGRELELIVENWVFDLRRNNTRQARSICRDCHNARERNKRSARQGEPRREPTLAQINNGWGSTFSKRAEAAGFTPGVRKAGRWKVRRNPAVRLELQGSQWLVQLCQDGQWWPATDAEVELWLRLGGKV